MSAPAAPGSGRPSMTGSDIVRPEPADIGQVSKKSRSRRAKLPRSQSTSNMLDTVAAPTRNLKYEPRDGGLDRDHERNNMRDLAKFFRTTAPPVNHGHTHDNCLPLGGCAAEDTKKLSLQSLMKRRRAAKIGTQSLQLQLSDKIIAKKSIEGYPYATITLPYEMNATEPLPSLQHPPLSGHLRHMSGPPRLPERTTSRGATRAGLESSPKSSTVESRNRARKSSSAHSKGPSREDLKNFTEARLAATSFLESLTLDLKSTHDEDDESPATTSQERQNSPAQTDKISPTTVTLEPSIKLDAPSTIQTGLVEFPATPPSSGQLQQFEWPEVVINSPEPLSPTSGESILSRRRQNSLANIATSTSVKARNFPKKPLNIATQQSLAVPETNILPESPGFPTMLAAMTFPSPPKTSRSASLATVTGQLSLQAGRPITSSATTDSSLPGATSLNAAVLRLVRPALTHSQSEYTLRVRDDVSVQTTPDMIISNFNLPARNETNELGATSPRSFVTPVAVDEPSPGRPGSSLSSVTACGEHRESTVSALSDATASRHSTSSILTTTTDSHRRSSSTSITNRQSTRSNATTVSDAPSLDGGYGRYEEGTNSTPRSPRSPVEPLSPFLGFGTSPPRKSLSLYPAQAGEDELLMLQQHTLGTANSKLKTLAERRMKRPGQSSEQSERSIDLTHSAKRPPLRAASSFESVDSPVLGWFSHSSVPVRKASIHGPSPLAHIAPLIAAEQSAEVVIEIRPTEPDSSSIPAGISRDDCLPTRIPVPESMDRGHSLSAASVQSPKKSGWSISPIMATTIEPAISPGTASRQLTISPLIIVADLEPKAESLNLRLSAIFSVDTAPAPQLPAKSPRRPGFTAKRLSRQIPLPLKVAIPSSETTAQAMPGGNQLLGRAGLPTTATSRALKRMSLPIYMSASNSNLLPWNHVPTSRLRETHAAYGPENQSEQEPEPETEDEPEPMPRRRSVIIKERFHQARLIREQELADLVAKTAITTDGTTKTQLDSEVDKDEEKANIDEAWEKESITTDDIEQRIQRLETHGDAWRSVLDPMLVNMNRTLREMKKDGRKSSLLLMEEFMIDMAAEARRSMLSTSPTEGTGHHVNKKTVTFDGFDGTHSPAETKVAPPPEPAEDIRIRKSGRSRSPSQIARLRLPLETNEKVHESQPVAPQATAVSDDVEIRPQILTVPEPDPKDNPRTPQQHEFEANLSVRRRIEAQEAMMDKLMTKWDMPRMSQDSSRSSRRHGSEASSCSHLTQKPSGSGGSSVEKPTVNEAEAPDTLKDSLGALKNTPLTKFRSKEMENSVGGSNSRRGSRRWSSAGERMSWKPGDNGFMNGLMQELRDTSRLSFESRADLESLF